MDELKKAIESAATAAAKDVGEFLTSTDNTEARVERARIAVHAVSVFATALGVLRNELSTVPKN